MASLSACSSEDNLASVQKRILAEADTESSNKVTFVITLPRGSSAGDTLASASERLQIDSRVVLGTSDRAETVASLGTRGLELAAEAKVNGDVFSVGNVKLGSRSSITGTLSTSGSVLRQDGALVGEEHLGETVLSTTESWSVEWPTVTNDSVFLSPDQERSLEPGAYGGLDVHSRAKVHLTSGEYFFESFNLEPQAEVVLDNEDGQVFIYVRNSFVFKGSFSEASEIKGQVLVGYVGQLPALLEGPFMGQIVAPNATVELRRPNNGQHRGSFFGKEIHVFSDSQIERLPFDWGFLCGSGSWSCRTCFDYDLELVDIQADFRDIWLGREIPDTGKRLSIEPTVTLEFNQKVEADRVILYAIGNVPGATDGKALDCVDEDGMPRENVTRHHRVQLRPEFPGALGITHSFVADRRFKAGCEYEIILAQSAATPGQSCLSSEMILGVRVEDYEQTAFSRETEGREFDLADRTYTKFSASLGKNAPAQELFSRYSDALGLSQEDTLKPVQGTHTAVSLPSLSQTRYRQYYRGIPVLGYGYLVHHDGENFRDAVGRVAKLAGTDVVPNTTGSAAISSALSHLAQTFPDAATYDGTLAVVELILSPLYSASTHREFDLVWRVSVPGHSGATFVDLDANTGVLLHLQTLTEHCAGIDGEPENYTLLSHETDTVSARYAPGVSADADMVYQVWDVDGENYSILGGALPFIHFTSDLRAANSTDEGTTPACKDDTSGWSPASTVHRGIQDTAGLFSELGFAGVPWGPYRGDGSGVLEALLVTDPTHSSSFIRAPSSIEPDQLLVMEHENYANSIAHELAHANHQYAEIALGKHPTRVNESASISEGFADFIAAVAGYRSGPSTFDHWCMANDVGCLRHIANPTALSSKPLPSFYRGANWVDYSDPACGNCAHENSTVVSHAFYLASMGQAKTAVTEAGCHAPVVPLSSVPTESRQLVAQIAFAGLAEMDDTADFASARQMTSNAALNLYGIDAARSIRQAWSAVGVGSPHFQITPEPGATGVNPWPTKISIEVEELSGPWKVRYSKHKDFTNSTELELSTTYSENNRFFAEIEFDLDPETEYFWQVIEAGGNEDPSWSNCGSEGASFTTKKVKAHLSVPSEKDSGGYYRLDPYGTMHWDRVHGATGYEVNFSRIEQPCELLSGWQGVQATPSFSNGIERFPGDVLVYLGESLGPAEHLLYTNPLFLGEGANGPAFLGETETFKQDDDVWVYIRPLRDDSVGSCSKVRVRKSELYPFEQYSPIGQITVDYESDLVFKWQHHTNVEKYTLTINTDVFDEAETTDNRIVEQIDIGNPQGGQDWEIKDGVFIYTPINKELAKQKGRSLWSVYASNGDDYWRIAYHEDSVAGEYFGWNSFYAAAQQVSGGKTPRSSEVETNFGAEILVDFDRREPPYKTKRCVTVPDNTVGIRYRWNEYNGNEGDWIYEEVRSGEEFCVNNLEMTQDIMVLYMQSYSYEPRYGGRKGFSDITGYAFVANYCGGEGEECCPADSDTGCSEGQVCSNKVCTTCGDKGEPCCEDDPQCDDNDLVCEQGTCQDCGGQGEFCCDGGECRNAHNICEGNKCRNCGQAGEVCCKDGTCLGGIACSEGTCIEPKSCGEQVTAGANVGGTYAVDLGKNQGRARIYYATYEAKDKITVRDSDGDVLNHPECIGTDLLSATQECNGAWETAASACCIGFDQDYNITTQCWEDFGYQTQRGIVYVEVEPNCGDTKDTAWVFSLTCGQ